MAKRTLSSLTKAKNNLRPYFNAPKENAYSRHKRSSGGLYWKGLQAIRRETPPSDLSVVFEQVEENTAYPFQGLGNTFPQDPGTAPNLYMSPLKPLTLAAELRLQIARLNYHSEQLAPALRSLAYINQSLIDGDLERARSAISSHKIRFGHSIIVAKKELLVGLHTHGHAGLSEVYRSLTADHRRSAWSLICHYIYDVMDPTFDPIRAARIWLNIARDRMSDSAWYCRILEHEVLGTPTAENTFSDTLLRYSAVSLLDLIIFLWKARHAFSSVPIVGSILKELDAPLVSALTEEFSELLVVAPTAYRKTPDRYTDVELYRIACFFDEAANIIQWRASVNRLAFPESFEPRIRYAPEAYMPLDAAAQAIAVAPERAAELTVKLQEWESCIAPNERGPSNQTLLKVLLVSESLSKIGADVPRIKLAGLIARTPDVHQYVPMATLVQLAFSPLAVAEPLLQFLFRELIFRKNRNDDNELERRLAFMAIFKEKMRHDIVPYFESLSSENRALALLLARTCTRTFLERLFSLMTSVKDVLETRLAICGWLAGVVGAADASLKEEYDALERELANLDARSDLDSTRVHVDEESFREWFDETQAVNIARYMQTVVAEGPAREHESFLSYASQERVVSTNDDLSADTQIGSEFLLLSTVDSSLKAFSTDRTFGLDSYLSRRIRHGTLSGHVMTPINRVLRRLAEKASDFDQLGPSARDFIEDISKFVRAELDHARKNVIQIRSEAHPEGLIRVTWRTSGNIKYLDAMFARVRERVLETNGAYDPFPDIYALAWDCLERDLAHLRLYMARSFLPKVVNYMRDLYQGLPLQSRNIVQPYWVELYQIVEARVLDICGWFIRPVFRRDKYDLKMLINSSLSIVRELNDEAQFTEEVVMFHDVPLSRGSFEVVGDALFVLLGNAARHGKRDGVIRIRAGQLNADENMVVLAVESQVNTLEEFQRSTERIKAAFAGQGAAVPDRAAVEEGFSGLGKLRSILQRVKSADAKLRMIAAASKLLITFEVTVPSQISFSRERG